MAKQDSSKMWSVMSLVSGLMAATAVRKALNAGWKVATGKEPPANPADPDVALREAVTWAFASGTSVALARMLAARRAATYYVKSTGHLPPELESDAVKEAKAAAAAAQEEAEASARGKDKKKKRRKKS